MLITKIDLEVYLGMSEGGIVDEGGECSSNDDCFPVFGKCTPASWSSSYCVTFGSTSTFGFARGLNEGSMLKEAGAPYWSSDRCGVDFPPYPLCPDGVSGCGCTGFNARPGGYRMVNPPSGLPHPYVQVSSGAFFWSADSDSSSYRIISSTSEGINRHQATGGSKQNGYSVRCVKD